MGLVVTVAAIEPGVAGTAVSATTVAVAVAGVPAVPSDGVTCTGTLSPASPLPEIARSKLSLVAVVFEVVLRVVVPTRQTYVRVTGSASRSVVVTVAVTIAFASGDDESRTTDALGGLLPIVIAADVT